MNASEFIKINNNASANQIVILNVAKEYADAKDVSRNEIAEELLSLGIFTNKNIDVAVTKVLDKIYLAKDKAMKARVKGVIFVAKIRRGSKTIYAGTIEGLIDKTFGYTLECGHSWDSKIPERPKTKTSLINALNRSADVCNNWSNRYELSSYEDFKANGGELGEDKHGYVVCK